MLMLTHTYFLQNILGRAGIKNCDPDIFVYNIVPDLLTFHPNINSQQTHKIRRFAESPSLYPKAAYIMFHLLVDDLAHYGYISSGIPDDFKPDSRGYTYLKGKPLIDSILDFQEKVNKKITSDEAAYRSHLIVEMIYDLAIIDQIRENKTIELMADSVHFTARAKMHEFVSTVNWLYGFDKAEICEVMQRADSYITCERMQKAMNMEGRIRLYAYKFGLHYDEQLNSGIKNIFLQAKELLDDNETFLRDTAEAVKKYGWTPVK